MSTALTVSHSAPLPAIPAADAERARGFANAEKAAATRRAYGTDFAIFRAWCTERRLDALPASPATVAAFLAHEASRNVKASTTVAGAGSDNGQTLRGAPRAADRG